MSLLLQMEVGGTEEMSNQKKKKVEVNWLNHTIFCECKRKNSTLLSMGNFMSSFNVGERITMVFSLCS